MTGKIVLTARQQSILDYVNNAGSAQIKDLAIELSVSEATVRRDFDEIALSGLVERVHGGIVKANGTAFERIHSEKMQSMLQEKQRIARKAASLVSNGDSLFLDSGSTTFFIAQNLANLTDLTIVTNNLDIAYSCQFHPTTSLLVTGGVRRDNYSVLIGDVAENMLKSFFVDIAFMGCDAISIENGVYNTNFMELGIKKQIVQCGKRLILVTDSSKFHKKALAKVCDVQELDMVITDTGLDEEAFESLKKIVVNSYCV